MTGKEAAKSVRRTCQYLKNVIVPLQEEHGDFRPRPGMMSVSEQIRHVANTVNWFREGAWGAGFDMDFEKIEAEIHRPGTLAESIEALDRAYGDFAEFLEGQSAEELMEPMADNPVFGQAPKILTLNADADHTAHHRGSLSVYIRLLDMVPPMPYIDPDAAPQE